MNAQHTLTDNGSPCVLVIAGLDPSGGAGLAADIRAVRHAGAWPCPVCAAITVQSTDGLVSVVPVESTLVSAQAAEALRVQRIHAMKVGALGSLKNAAAVLELVAANPHVPCVVDPVGRPTLTTSNATLFESTSRDVLLRLAAAATLVTPNIPEASWMADSSIDSESDMEAVAVQLRDTLCTSVLVKGGHLASQYSVDVLATEHGVSRIKRRRWRVPEVHGTGCALASLIAGRLALLPQSPDNLLESVRYATRTVARSLRSSIDVGGTLRVLFL